MRRGRVVSCHALLLGLDVAQSHHARRIGTGRREGEFRIDAIGEHAPQTSRSFARAKALAQDDNVWWLAGKKKGRRS